MAATNVTFCSSSSSPAHVTVVYANHTVVVTPWRCALVPDYVRYDFKIDGPSTPGITFDGDSIQEQKKNCE